MQENNTVFCKYGKEKVKFLTEKANISHKTREPEDILEALCLQTHAFECCSHASLLSLTPPYSFATCSP